MKDRRIEGFALIQSTGECPHEDNQWEFHEDVDSARERQDEVVRAFAGSLKRVQIVKATLTIH